MATGYIVRTSSCLCGKTGLKLKGKPAFQVQCHCTICQKLSGSSAFNIAYATAEVEIAKGGDNWTKYNTSKNLTRHFCKSCGIYMMGVLGGDMNVVAVPAGTIDREAGLIDSSLMPQHHIFYNNRMLDVSDDLPKWAGFFDKSERVG